MYQPHSYPYPSQRQVVYAKRGMVATSQPLAAQAGLEVLQKGGNAIDAAVAAAACLTVVEPTSNGVGGDAFALVWHQGKLYGLNASGPSPALLTLDAVKKEGGDRMPQYGWAPVNVPGAPKAWAELSKRFGALSLADALEPAVRYAEEGYPINVTSGLCWEVAWDRIKDAIKGEKHRAWFDMFAPNGRIPRIGEMWGNRDLAKSLAMIGETNADAFYKGAIAEKIDAFSRATGGYLRGEDLADYEAEWVDPISVRYHGYDVWEIPPNGHGLVALMALNILDGFEFGEKEDALTYHRQIEAMKLAFVDGMKYIADPRHMQVSVQDLLSPAYAATRRASIGDMARLPEPGDPNCGGTVYLATADNEGNMVSFIQSNYNDLGAGIVVPGTGIALHNRGQNFYLDPTSPNCVGPRKKPYHTIIPGFLTKDGAPVGPFGVMGAFMQPQGHVQVVMNTIDFHLNPQAALDATRWQWLSGNNIEVEPDCDPRIVEELKRRGHNVSIQPSVTPFGRGQIIWRENGVLVGGTEKRTDGTIACW